MTDLSHLSLIDNKPFNQIYELDAEQIKQHVNNLVEIIREISENHLNKLILVTGCNGSGKSMLRKQVGLTLKTQNKKSASTSMEQRTVQNSNFGALSGIMNDNQWSATSDNSLFMINQLFKTCSEYFMVVDEPEIGMSTAMTKAISQKLIDFYDKSENGMMVISHNQHVVSKLLQHNDVVFVNLNGLSAEDYLKSFDDNGTSFDLEAFRNYKLLFKEIQNRTKS